jgi:hypothetical protein
VLPRVNKIQQACLAQLVERTLGKGEVRWFESTSRPHVLL